MRTYRTLLSCLALSTSVASLACGSSSDDAPVADPLPAREVSATGPEGGPTAAPDAGSPSKDVGDAGTALAASGTLTANGSIGAPGQAAAAFSFGQPVGARVRLKTGSVTTSCGDVLLEYVGDHLFVEVIGCASEQTIDVVFSLPLHAGSFPNDDDAFPGPQVQLWRAHKGQPYVDQGSASYGNIEKSTGTNLTVTNVVSKSGSVDLDVHLSGTIDANVSCSQCTVGGPQITIDLKLDLVNVPTT